MAAPTADHSDDAPEQVSLFQGGPFDPDSQDPEGGASFSDQIEEAAAPTEDFAEDPAEEKAAAPASEPEAPAEPSSFSQDDIDIAVAKARAEGKDDALSTILAGRPAAPAPAPVVDPRSVDPGTAPDAISDPEGHTAWLDAKLAHQDWRTEQRIAHEKETITTTNRLEGMWETFQAKYPEAAADSDLVAAAVSVEIRKNGGQLPSDESAFLKSINDRIMGPRSRAADPDEGDGDPQAPAAASESEPSKARRTAGVSGGSKSRRAPRKRAASEEGAAPGLGEQILNLQEKSGLL
jgi:hypothetical protein